MELTKLAISRNKDKILGIDGYYLITGKIERNVDIHPDITIEACKSLIEGLCKKALWQIDEDYNSKKKLRNDLDSNLSKLVVTAFNKVYVNRLVAELHENLFYLIKDKERLQKFIKKANDNIFNRTKGAINKIIALRDERGDISHGRNYPKEFESEVYLAQSIVSITDGICSYMINELSRQMEVVEVKKKLNYHELEDYNDWLDKKTEFEFTKLKLSTILFDDSYNKYEEVYYNDYLEILVDEIEGSDVVVSDTLVTEKYDESKIENLVNTFNGASFWTEKRREGLAAIALTNSFTVDGLGKLISDYLSDDRPPLRDDIRKIYRGKMSLQELRTALPELEKKIVEWSQIIKDIK